MDLVRCYSSDSEQEKDSDLDDYDMELTGTSHKVQKTSEDGVDVHESSDRSQLCVPEEILRLDPATHQAGSFEGQFSQSFANTRSRDNDRELETAYYRKLSVRSKSSEGQGATRPPIATTVNPEETVQSDHMTFDVDISSIPEAIRSVVDAKPDGSLRYYLPKKCCLRLSNHKGKVNRIDWTRPHGQLLASAAMDGTVRVWDPFIRKKCVQLFQGHSGAVREAKWTSSGKEILSCSYDKTVKLWDVQTGKEVASFLHPGFVTAVEFHPTLNSSFISGCFTSQIIGWDLRCSKATNQYSGTEGHVQDLEFLPDGSEFLSATDVVRRSAYEKALMAWDFRTTAVMSHQIFQEPYTCTSLTAHPDQCQFIAQTHGNYIAIFSSKRPYKLNKYRRFEGGHQVLGYPLSCSIRADGLVVGSGSADGCIAFYDYFSGKTVASVKSAHAGPSTDVQFHPVLPSTVASCGWDCVVAIWK